MIGLQFVDTRSSLNRMFVRSKRDFNRGDRLFSRLISLPAMALITLFLGMLGVVLHASLPSLKKTGFAFFATSTWDPVREQFGALPVIYGTLVTSFLAVLIATPLSIGVALFLNELAPKRLGVVLGFLIEMLAAIPSVVFGLWGLFVLAPTLRTSVQPFLTATLGSLPGMAFLFQGTPYGVGLLAASLILSIMIVPTVASICREVFRAIPKDLKEAALGLGATRWEMFRVAILRSGRVGVFGAVTLGLGRALGETMAVTMLIGNQSRIVFSLHAPGQTMASAIANEYAEAFSDGHRAALMEVGLVLFVVTFAVNAIARVMVVRLAGRTRV